MLLWLIKESLYTSTLHNTSPIYIASTLVIMRGLACRTQDWTKSLTFWALSGFRLIHANTCIGVCREAATAYFNLVVNDYFVIKVTFAASRFLLPWVLHFVIHICIFLKSFFKSEKPWSRVLKLVNKVKIFGVWLTSSTTPPPGKPRWFTNSNHVGL